MSHTHTRNPDETDPATFGERMALARDRKGLSQLQLAALVLPESQRVATISKWENGRSAPDAHTLAAIARALDVSADWLLFGGEEKPADVSRRALEQIAAVVDRYRTGLSSDASAHEVAGLLAEAVDRAGGQAAGPTERTEADDHLGNDGPRSDRAGGTA